MRSWTAAVLAATLFGMVFAASAPALAQMQANTGYGRIAPGGKPGVAVERPVLVIMMDFQDQKFAPGHDAAFYRNKLFGPGFPNVRDAYLENSGGLFSIREAGIVGPVHMPNDPATEGADESMRSCVPSQKGCETSSRSESRDPATAIRLAAAAGFSFKAFDKNNDARITDDELMVVVVTAGPPPHCGLARPLDPYGEVVGLPYVPVSIQLRLVGSFSEGTNFQTITHEMSHTLGTRDLYGPSGRPFAPTVNNGSTLMGATCSSTDAAINLDAWTRIQLGWAKPRVVNLRKAGQCLWLDATSRRGAVRVERDPIVLWDSGRGPNELFILEFRNRQPRREGEPAPAAGTAAAGYDGNVVDTGVAVWSARHEANGDAVYPVYTSIERGADRAADRLLKPLLGTTPSGDDVAVDVDGDRAPDVILWGNDNVLQSKVRAGTLDSAHGGIGVFVASPQQRGAGWQTGDLGNVSGYFTATHGEFALIWPGGRDSGFRVQVGPTGTDSVAVRVATAVSTGAAAASTAVTRIGGSTTARVGGSVSFFNNARSCEDLTTGPPKLEVPDCVERPTRVRSGISTTLPGATYAFDATVRLSRPVRAATSVSLAVLAGKAEVRGSRTVTMAPGATTQKFVVDVASPDFDEISLSAQAATTPVAGGVTVKQTTTATVRVTPNTPPTAGDTRLTCTQTARLQGQVDALRHLVAHLRRGPVPGQPHFSPFATQPLRVSGAVALNAKLLTSRFRIPGGARVMSHSSGAVDLVPETDAPIARVARSVLPALERQLAASRRQLQASAAKIKAGVKSKRTTPAAPFVAPTPSEPVTPVAPPAPSDLTAPSETLAPGASVAPVPPMASPALTVKPATSLQNLLAPRKKRIAP